MTSEGWAISTLRMLKEGGDFEKSDKWGDIANFGVLAIFILVLQNIKKESPGKNVLDLILQLSKSVKQDATMPAFSLLQQSL